MIGDEEQPVCDFCDMSIDEDEDLEPIYVGELPQPKPHHLSQVAQRGGMRGNRYKGKYDALRKALYDCPDIDLNESNVVHEDELMDAPSPNDFTTKRTEKVGASIKIRPKDVTYEADAELCENCVEMLRSL